MTPALPATAAADLAQAPPPAHDPAVVIAAVEAALPGARVTTITPLWGGMSAELHALVFEDGREVVVRYPHPYQGTLHPDPVAHERDTLAALYAAGLPVPAPLAIAGSGDDRCLVMQRLPGHPLVAPSDPDHYVRVMAETLAHIHTTPVAAFGFLPETRSSPKPPGASMDDDLRESEVRAALGRWGAVTLGPTVLRHGDFWPGNVLWVDDRLTGVIDWENALRGPALADLAITRLDLWWALGRAAMEAFTAHYLRLHPLPLDLLPYWDLRTALRPMGDLAGWSAPYAALGRFDVTHATMRADLLAFLDQALSHPSS